ncbi:PREDICTED: zinc-finger homeodomain protein 4 [Ipomoea nil]|uniref:zinc-finger homeodomain protein 4 n=1 Tax=Ipomoea nil TaxID=35883 RepID=UPI0009009CCB|nr:PREDICTED: zinc-finger homeodomain protein 4 [Ipomoea nil]
MEIPSSHEDGEMPIPINSTYGHGHGQHIIMHHNQNNNNNHIIIPSAPPSSINGVPVESTAKKQMVRYRECLKNHAAAMGGNATDGCGEFMPSGEEGSLEALTCSACNCHRNFHRKEVEGEPLLSLQIPPSPPCHCTYHHKRKVFVGAEPLGGVGYPRPPPHQMIMSYNMGGSLHPSDQSDEHEEGGGGGGGGGGGVVLRPPLHQMGMVKKRFRTKFTQEQKDKMLSFAERVGWKIQKQEESVVQQFCQEVGIKRRVLKVWMHNNKHNLAKKTIQNPNPNPPQIQL